MYRVSLKIAMESIVKEKLLNDKELTNQKEETAFKVDFTHTFDLVDF